MSTSSDLILTRVRDYVHLHELLSPGALIVGVSGGIDSLVLLHILIQLAPQGELQLFAATFNHHIRGEDAHADVIAVQRVGEAWHIPVIAGEADVPAQAQKWHLNLEAAARRARYQFLSMAADQVGANQITVAHHRDDQAETVLMRLIRGTGLEGLRGMLPRTPVPEVNRSDLSLMRPLLCLSRAEINAYAAQHQISPRHDLSNADTRFTRSKVRHQILPLLASLNPEVNAALARLAENAQDDYAALLTLMPPIHQTFEGVAISREAFLAAPRAVAGMTLRQAAARLLDEIGLSFARVRQIHTWIMSGIMGEQDLSGGLRIAQRGEWITIFDPAHYPAAFPWMSPGAKLDLPEPGEYSLPGSDWKVYVEPLKVPVPPSTDPLSLQLSVPEQSALALRTFRLGDRFHPQGLRGHSQKLSDTLTNLKVREVWRDRIPLLTVDDHILWFAPPGIKPRWGEFTTAEADQRQLRLRFYSTLSQPSQ